MRHERTAAGAVRVLPALPSRGGRHYDAIPGRSSRRHVPSPRHHRSRPSVIQGKVVLASDGQVTLGQTVVKHQARKVRRLYHDRVLAGFAGTAADGFALFSRFESKLEEHRGNLERAAVELARDWRTDRALRRLEAMMLVADTRAMYLLSGTGDLIEPDDGVMGIGSGGPFAMAAARALVAAQRARRARHRRAGDGHRRRHLHLHEQPARRWKSCDMTPIPLPESTAARSPSR